MSVLRETEGIVKEIRAREAEKEYAPLFAAAARFLQKTGGSKTVN